MALSVIENNVMNAQLRFMTDMLEIQKNQAEAMQRIATQLEEMMKFLHGTTIEQVERKRQQMKKKTQKNDTSEVEAMKEFMQKQTEV
tara:strand:+ start:7123 stop:7383 length:261 start_codon:yes stop_codon:yes gene_type:complete